MMTLEEQRVAIRELIEAAWTIPLMNRLEKAIEAVEQIIQGNK